MPTAVADLRVPVTTNARQSLCPRKLTLKVSVLMRWMSFLISPADERGTSNSETNGLALLLDLEVSIKLP